MSTSATFLNSGILKYDIPDRCASSDAEEIAKEEMYGKPEAPVTLQMLPYHKCKVGRGMTGLETFQTNAHSLLRRLSQHFFIRSHGGLHHNLGLVLLCG